MIPRPQLFREPGADGSLPGPEKVNVLSARTRASLLIVLDGCVRRYAESHVMLFEQAADGAGGRALTAILRLLGGFE